MVERVGVSRMRDFCLAELKLITHGFKSNGEKEEFTEIRVGEFQIN